MTLPTDLLDTIKDAWAGRTGLAVLYDAKGVVELSLAFQDQAHKPDIPLVFVPDKYGGLFYV